ncbi:MAG: endonuclease MutS2 [Chloroflexi bacterium]|nr:endonuclease MutS2 [Chloroflexota bacterium]
MKHTVETLELPKILERLARHTSFSASRELAFSLSPSSDEQAVSSLQCTTTEARRLLELKPTISLAGARDVRDVVHRARLGGILEPRELLDVLATLLAGRTVRTALSRLSNQFPLLAARAECIAVSPDLEQEIQRSIDPQGEILDGASPILRRLRAEVKLAHRRLLDRLESLISSGSYRNVIQEPIITLRQGRYVIPIKTDFKGQFRGIVHDQSASGATVFVEPLETVDVNNRWRELQIEEQREIQRILRNLSAAVGSLEADLIHSVVAMAEIDLALAKGRYSAELSAVQPEITGNSPRDGVFLELVNARHPLLGDEVVPISARLGGDFFVLVITGPNTGGKTVALKTIGLLALMFQCGLHIPVDRGSRIRVFDNVYADIGDEQSIEQSLSTFSSHLTRVNEVLRSADEHSLVLLDEIGAGTDPTEGSALAKAILSYLVRRRIPTIATTHYSELKAYAHATAGVENACVEFDAETLAPTYKLSIGLPGRSNALAIAQRLGVPREVIDSAMREIRPSEMQVDRLLTQIQQERDRAAEHRAGAERAQTETERLREELGRKLHELEQERLAILEQARRDSEALVTEVRQRLRSIIVPLEKAPVSRGQLVAAGAEIRVIEEEVEAVGRPSVAEPPPAVDQSGRPLRAGDFVLVKSLGQYGELISPPEGRGEAEVQLGSFKAKVRPGDIVRIKSRPKVAADYFPDYHVSLATRLTPLPELGIHGWRVEQVLPELERYVNDAYLCGLHTVRIVHGKGTGVLRQVVREQLAHNPLVKSYQSAEPREGGDGVTVVTLAN